MALTLITGEPGSGKTELLYQVIRESASDAVPILLLPSAPDASRARQDLVRDASLPGPHIEQIDTFLATAWELYGDGRKLVTALQRNALLRTAIATHGLCTLTDSSTTPGFLSLMERLVSIQWDVPRPAGERDLGRAIAETVVGYGDSLRTHGLVELSEATWILAERVEPGWFDGPLLANRFDDLTKPQEHFFVRAARANVAVYIAVTGEADSRMTEATGELINRLLGHADHHVVPASTRDCSNELRSLEHTLLTGTGGVESEGDVRLSVGLGEEAEAERIAAEVLAASSEGIAFGDIAVIYRDTRRHHAALRRAFAQADISADFDMRVRFGETAFGRAVLALLDFGATGARVSLTAFLSSGYVGMRLEDVDELDALWRQRPSTDADGMAKDLERVSSDVRRFVVGATRLAREGVRATNAAAWKNLAGELLARAHGRSAPALGRDALLDASAHKKLCQAVDDIGAVADMGLEQSSIRQVLAEARIALGGVETSGKVQVMDVERVRGREFECVIIAGLSAGEFPLVLDSGVYESEAFRSRLKAQGIQTPRNGGLEAERLFFFTALTRARRRLVFSRQAADSDGRPLRPSILLEEVLAAYVHQGKDDTPLPERVLAFHDLGFHKDAPPLARRALRSVALCEPGNDPGSVARARSRYEQRAGVIADASILEALAGRTIFSATELEDYLACPYRWFYSRFLRPESLGEDPEQLRKGSLAHQALADFYTRLPGELGCHRVTPENLAACLSLCESVLAQTLAQEASTDHVENRMMAQSVRRDVVRLVRRDAEYLPGFAPDMIEWSFGLISDPPQDFDGFSLRGRVDRVDVGPVGLVVIDYKSGKAIRGARFETDGVLQAPLYAEVVRRRTGKPVVGTLYRSLSATANCDMSRGIYDASCVAGTELTSTDAQISIDESISSAIERAGRAAAGIRSGIIPREPLSAASCTYCGASTWCKEVQAR